MLLRDRKKKTDEHEKPILDLKYRNSLCELISEANDLLNYARIAEIGPNWLTLKPSREGLVLSVLYFNTPVKVNVYNTSLGFRVLSGVVGLSSAKELKVIETTILADSDRRQFFRMRIHCPARLEIARDQEPLEVSLEDISLSGLQFSSTEAFTPQSHYRITFDLEGYRLTLRCQVRRILSKDEETGIFGYGCNITDLSPSDESTLHKILLRLQQQSRAQSRED